MPNTVTPPSSRPVPSIATEQVLQAERAARAGTWNWYMSNGTFSWSPAFFELFGLDPSITPANLDVWASTLHPEDRAGAEAGYGQAIEQRIPLFIQYRIILPDGRIRWIDAYGDMAYDDSGNPVRMSGICVDATERMTLALDNATLEHRLAELRLTEQRLRESENRLELALAASGVGLWDYQVLSGQVDFDKHWCALLGLAQDEITPSADSWRRMTHPDDAIVVNQVFRTYLNGGVPKFEVEYRLRHKDGHWVWVLSRGQIVERDAQGNPLRLVGTILDISNQKRMLEEGQTLLQRFELLIREVATPPSNRLKPDEADTALELLSRRQKQILVMIAHGLNSQQIADTIGIAKDTVATHRRELLRKLNLHSAADLTRYAVEHGLTAR